MSATDISESATDTSERKAPPEIKAEDFSRLIVGMSRLLTGLARLDPFSNAEMGLSEWIALTTLAENDGINNKMLARHLGVTGQRANQICAALSRDKLIEVSQSAKDNRANEIRITEAGKAKVNSVNAQLKPLLSEALAGKEGSVASASKQLRHVMRVLRADKGEQGKPDEKDREAKRAAKLARREQGKPDEKDREAKRAAKLARREQGKPDEKDREAKRAAKLARKAEAA